VKINLQRLLFFWIAGFILALSGYFLLHCLMPDGQIFGALYRMFVYHWKHPVSYIAIPCFFYGIFATALSTYFNKRKLFGKIILTLLILILTILFSSPFGGMLWHYHDMQAGYFPVGWIKKMIVTGSEQGLEIGWVVILLSFPYNLLGAILCFFLSRYGAEKIK